MERQTIFSHRISENGPSGNWGLIWPLLALEGGLDDMIDEGAEGLGIHYVMVVAVSAVLLVVALGLLYLVKRLFRKKLHPVVDKAIHPLALPAREFYGTQWMDTWGKRRGWTIFDAWENHDDCVGDCINPSVWSSSLRAALIAIIKRLSGKLRTPSQDFREVTILSIGSGVATVEGLLRADGFKSLIALDNMFRAVEIAHHKGLKSAQADGLRLPFKDGSIKMAYMDASLGHLVESYDPPFDFPYNKALIEVRRVLASDGILMLVDNPLEEWQQPYGVDEFVQMLRARTPEMSAELRKAGFEILGGEDMKGVWNNNPDYIKYPRPNWRTAGKDYAYYVRRIVLAGKKAGVQVEHPER